MREANIELLRRGYDAFAKGDFDTIRGISAEDGVWKTPGFGEFKVEYKGIDGTIEYLTKLFELTDGTIKVEPVAFLADDDRVAVLEHLTATRKGKLLDVHTMHVYDVHEGKVFETTEFLAEPDVLKAFWV